MSSKTGISWTDSTWNPVRGCSRVSEGCRNCYAEAVAARFSGPGQPYEGLAKYVGGVHDTSDGTYKRVEREPRWTGEVRVIEHVLDQPLRWTRPRRIFVNSMSDLFHESIPYQQIARIFGVMLLAERHTFQVLTKRPDRMASWFRWIESNPLYLGESAATSKRYEVGAAASCLAILGNTLTPEQIRGPLFTAAIAGGVKPAPDAAIRMRWPLPNVHLGVSIEDQKTADERIPLLLETPAAVRFVSAEPLLGPVDLAGPGFLMVNGCHTFPDGEAMPHLCGGFRSSPCPGSPRVDWVVVGGESGPSARPFDVAWARRIVADCREAKVPAFVKQLGARPIDPERIPHDPNDAPIRGGVATPAQLERIAELCEMGMVRLRDRKGGDPSEWPQDLRVQEFPA